MSAATGMISMSFIILGRKETPACVDVGNNTTCDANNYCNYKYKFPLNGTFSYSSSYNLYCENEYMFPLPTVLYFFGFAIGAWSGGMVSDTFGRKPVFIYSSIFTLMTNTLMCVTNVFQLFLGARFFLGVFIGSQ